MKSKGGEVLDLNTDCISCSFPNDVLPFDLEGKILRVAILMIIMKYPNIH